MHSANLLDVLKKYHQAKKEKSKPVNSTHALVPMLMNQQATISSSNTETQRAGINHSPASAFVSLASKKRSYSSNFTTQIDSSNKSQKQKSAHAIPVLTANKNIHEEDNNNQDSTLVMLEEKPESITVETEANVIIPAAILPPSVISASANQFNNESKQTPIPINQSRKNNFSIRMNQSSPLNDVDIFSFSQDLEKVIIVMQITIEKMNMHFNCLNSAEQIFKDGCRQGVYQFSLDFFRSLENEKNKISFTLNHLKQQLEKLCHFKALLFLQILVQNIQPVSNAEYSSNIESQMFSMSLIKKDLIDLLKRYTDMANIWALLQDSADEDNGFDTQHSLETFQGLSFFQPFSLLPQSFPARQPQSPSNQQILQPDFSVRRNSR